MTLVAAAILNIVIGVSGLVVGLTLIGALAGAAAASDLAIWSDLLLGIPVYGLFALLGGIGVWRGSWVGWTLALAVDLVGLAVLAWSLKIVAPDGVLLFGLAVWGLTTLLIVAPQTRSVLR